MSGDIVHLTTQRSRPVSIMEGVTSDYGTLDLIVQRPEVDARVVRRGRTQRRRGPRR